MENKNRSENFKIGGFTPESVYAKVLIPLLDGLGWMGNNSDLVEALSINQDTMDRTDLLHTMANLRYEGHRAKRLSYSAGKLPCLCIGRGEKLYLFLKEENGLLIIYDPQEDQYKKVKKLQGIKEFIVFEGLNSERLNLLSPQKGWFGKVLLRFKKEISMIVFLSILLAIVSFLTPLMIVLIYSQIEFAETSDIILRIGSAIALFIAATAGFKFLRSQLQNHFSARIGDLVQQEIFRRLLYLPPRYTEKTPKESQFARIRDFDSIKNFFSGTAFTSLIDGPLSIVMLIGLAILAKTVVWVPLITILIFIIGGFLAYKLYKQINEERAELSSKRGHLIAEYITMMGDPGSRWGIPLWQKRIKQTSSETRHSLFRSEQYLSMVTTIGSILVRMALVITITWSVFRVQNSLMDRGVLFAVFLITNRILSPLYSGLTVFSQVSKFRSSVEQLNRFMGLPVESRPETLVTLNKHLNGEIIFNKVFLKYGGEFSPALYNISFHLQTRQFLTVTGHSGSGKSSLLKLILAQYAPLSGSILIDGMNINQIDPLRLRKSIGYCPSDQMLFSGTIKQNLYLARPDALEEELEEALKFWNCYETIFSLKKGLETNISKLEKKSHSGEIIKKIQLSMAWLKKSPLLLIDDMDQVFKSEEQDYILGKLKELKKDSTLILVSQNENYLKNSDQIIWLDNGRILKQGTPLNILPEYLKQNSGMAGRIQ